MSPIERVWDLVGRRFTREPRLATSKDELLLRIQAIWNSLPQADIQNLFDSIPRCSSTYCNHLLQLSQFAQSSSKLRFQKAIPFNCLNDRVMPNETNSNTPSARV
ncbi:uncharacterized protein TNCV_3108581 [Trichonephila clavipes]|uniref:Transposase n=1 Tax=Trichonephila clavipes TaxID=2585209 RepID=A0A8X6S3L3_TRICX|nr:uncharacterized protein TNCV_3108581 [Trichonephila clavipes]